MTDQPIDYVAELEEMADSCGEYLAAEHEAILRGSADELSRLMLSESTLREKLDRANQEIEELYEELDRFRHPNPSRNEVDDV